MEIDEGLAVKVETETGRSHARIAQDRLRELVHTIGGAGNRFLVVQRVPDIPDEFAQVWHEEGGDYRLEHRRGAAGFCGTNLPAPAQAADLLIGWARRDAGWDAGVSWEPVGLGPAEEVPELPDEVREKVEERVRLLLRCGYDGRARLAEAAEEWLVDGDERPVSRAQAQRLVDRLWMERVTEQAAWVGTTDPERLTAAFEALNARGITGRENFTCCRSCGTAEIGGERAEGDRGFVYFHTQCTESAAAGRGLMLLYARFDGSEQTTAAVGREVVAALGAAGLSVMWDEDPDTAIEVTPLTWRKRLVG